MIRFILTGIACLWAAGAAAAVDIQEVTTDAGHEAWLVEERSIPFVSLELRFEGGASLDPEGKRGVTSLMTSLLEEGAGDLDARAFAEATEALAARLSFDVSDDELSVSARFLTENREEVMALLREALIAPRFDADAISRVKDQTRSSILSDRTDPDAIVGKVANDLIYGNHPYGSSRKGTEETLAAISRDDLLAAKDAALATDRVHIGAAGDISRFAYPGPGALAPRPAASVGVGPEGAKRRARPSSCRSRHRNRSRCSAIAASRATTTISSRPS